jgi:predicted DsbA family dithiol-disulfide isomerase
MSAAHATQPLHEDVTKVRLEMWADLGCPWCYLGIHRLHRAVDTLGVGGSVELVLRSFELDPGTSSEPVAISEIFTRKHGLSVQDARRAEERMAQLAGAEGLPFTSERRHANSFDVHRVLQLANRHGRGVESDLVGEVLAGDAYAEDVRGDEDAGRRVGISGVPFVVLNGRYAIAGAQSSEVYAQAIRQSLENTADDDWL